ncbi:MAG TPA: hypothetical protein VKS22_16815 [Candidatus Binataceae bacterium]|nr:hypothetical protein [Candidatus Binataceae bacterium]
MNRETLMSRLLWLREMRLREELTELKTRAAALSMVEQVREQARTAAILGSAADLRDLGAIGQVRLDSTRTAGAEAARVRAAGERVDQAHRQSDAIRGAHNDLLREKRFEQERAQEHDADQFQSWKRRVSPRGDKR